MTTHIIGMGALGTLFGYQIAQKRGLESVAFVMDQNRLAKYQNTPVLVNGTVVPFPMITPDMASPADLVIVAVKGPGLESALNTIQNSVGPDTIIISLLNGIVSEQVITARFGSDKVIHCVAQGTDAAFFDRKLTFVQKGQLRIGIVNPDLAPKLQKLAEFLTDCEINTVVEKDILHRMWGKFMMNVGLNQTCFVHGATYGDVQTEGESRSLMVAAMKEVIPLAAAEGVQLSDDDITAYLNLIDTFDKTSMPSMAQDRINQKKSEADLFAGTVIALGEKRGIATPVNQMLWDEIMKIESTY